MKKKYVKPQIYIENFSLDTTIAGDCEGIVGNPTKGTCAVLGTGGIAMFEDGMPSICDYTPPDGDKYDSFCYHVPTEYNNLFNS